MICIRSRIRVLTAVATAAVALTVPSGAFAQASDPASDQYDPICPSCSVESGDAGDPSADPGGAGGLPFSGLDLAGMGLAALALTGTGLAIRRAGTEA